MQLANQKKAAELLTSSALIEKLGPIGEWNVIEAMLRATIIPNLPKYVIGELYNQLSIASWNNQRDYDISHKYASKAMKLEVS